ncbi:MAG: hypothetical protein Q8R33_15555 [Burkholderiales bacterium]|nr:hypothetical protein [Burkholderiales bacterium]
MLLAIADFADDEGNAYPSVTTLANKCRMRPRNANYVLSALKASGELQVRENEGPRGTNRYRIMLNALQRSAGVQSSAGVQGIAPTPAIQGRLPLQPIADEPSGNHQEPPRSRKAKAKASPRLPTCPFQQIVECFHEILPELPPVKLLDTKGRKDGLEKFWTWVLTSSRSDGERRATNASEAIAWIRSYFERARGNDFLMRRTPPSPGHENWRCSLDFLVSDKGKLQVIERTEVAP